MAKAAPREFLISRLLSFRTVAILSVLATLMLLLSCGDVLLQSRNDLVRRADQMARNVVVLAQETLRIEINRYDTRLLDLVSALRQPDVSSLPDSTANNELFGGRAERDSLGDILIVAANGAVLRSSLPDLTSLYLHLVPDILAHPAAGDDALSVRTVWQSPRAPLIALARWCPPDQCGRAVAVIAIMPLTGVLGVFNGLILGRGGAISLLDNDGILLVRQPDAPAKIGTALMPPSEVVRLPRGKMTRTESVSRVDQVTRRYTFGWVAALPFIVSVGISTEDVSRGWIVWAAVIGVVVLLLSAGFVALTLLLAREVRRKTIAEGEVLEANRQLSELARTDQLTGLFNRRGFDENLAREWRRSRRAGTPISLLLLDADHFKAYNDRFGHQAGDRVLRMISDTMAGQIRRPGDVAARYGGEEFAVVLPDTDFNEGARIAEKIRLAVEALAIPHPDNGGGVTISVGLSAARPGREDPADMLIQIADAALYESKNLGRNRVTARRVSPPRASARSEA